MGRFDKIRAEEIVAMLQATFADCLTNFDYELQDGFDTLLIMCQLKVEPSDEFLSKLRIGLQSFMASMIDSGNDSFFWMINVYFRNELVESVIP